MSYQQILITLSFFQFVVELEPSRNWIPLDAWSTNLIYINKNPLFLQKLKKELKISNTALIPLLKSKGSIFARKCCFFAKNHNIIKINGALVPKDIFSETTYVFVLTS